MRERDATLLLIGIAIYLIAVVVTLLASLALLAMGMLPPHAEFMKLILMCCVVAGLGGCLYCLRAIYLNKCVRKSWDPEWASWYFLRPITSILSGGASYLFLKAGLLILESQESSSSSDFGFLALAFVAGLNVDKFIAKLEEIAKAVWGIEKSRVASGEDKTSG